MSYVDGFVLVVPKKKLKAYRRLAEMARKSWKRHGALDVKQCAGDDMKVHPMCGPSFRRLLKLKRGETAQFSFIVYKSRAHRDRVNAKVMKDMEQMGPPRDMPFDMKRMTHGGFKTIVE